MGHDVDVLVIGAGPVGLTLAIALRRLDLRVRNVDRASGTNREPRADVVFPRAGEALGALGVGDAIRRESYQMAGASFYGDGRLLGEFEVGRFVSRYPRAMTIEQHDIERLLADNLNGLGVSVDWRTTATDVRGDDSGVQVPLRSADGGVDVVNAAWVVGCDGSRSMVRDRLGIPFEGSRRENMQVIQGNVIPTWPLPDRPGHGYFFLAPYRSVIMFPTPNAGYRVFCVRDDPNPGHTEPPTLDELRDLVAAASGQPALTFTLTEPVWLSRARFADRVAGGLRRGRVLLAGDAAHSWAPIGGHGMNVGMLGAHNLAWKLAAVHRGEATDALLDTYESEQRALALGVIRDMRFNVMELLLPPLAHRTRSALLRVGMPWSSFQRRTEWMMSDFGRNHRRSPLSWPQPGRSGRSGPRAGDRMPDLTVIPADLDAPVEAAVAVLTPARAPAAGEAPGAVRSRPVTTGVAVGRPGRLHDVLRYDRWTVLLSTARADPATLGRLRDICGRAAAPMSVVPISVPVGEDVRALGPSGNLTVVRPDGYVGLVAPLNRMDALRDYIATFLPGSRRRT
ncbi:MAG: hypothetical protein QOE03_678 [Micromonosporaceae bacterium]|nr:hypothetical protein [Micromonosporaceae bacterium]